MAISGLLFLYAINEALYAKVVLIAVIPGIWAMKDIFLSLYAAEFRLLRRIIRRQLKNAEIKSLKPFKRHFPKVSVQ